MTNEVRNEGTSTHTRKTGERSEGPTREPRRDIALSEEKQSIGATEGSDPYRAGEAP